jgi:cation diffusion facilitator CzcD-associated flavoprotein CzcO
VSGSVRERRRFRQQSRRNLTAAPASGGAVAVVGGGLGGLVAYATLRHVGVDDVTVFGTDTDPAAVWRERAAAIRQRFMRSESDGHVAPASFPGLAVRAALRSGSPAPLLRSVADRYNPPVDDFLAHVAEVRERTAWDDALVRARVNRISAVDDGFDLDGRGIFRHVLIAPGHPGLTRPEELMGDPRAVHAYEPHEYADDVEVVGAGMAAATEWLNALAAGANVTSIRRREPERRPLNLPRTLFARRGLAAFHRAPQAERIGLLRRYSAPSYPPGRRWDEPLERAAAEGRFRIAAALNGAPQVICATGFKRGFRHDALLARLVEEHRLETAEDWIVLAPDSTIPALTDESRTLALAGVPAQWAFPAADTLAGMKYAAHRFAAKVVACPTR